MMVPRTAPLRLWAWRDRTYVTQLCVADLKAPAADGTDQVVVRPVGHDGHEVQAHRLLRPDVVEEHLVMTVRAHVRRDLAHILRVAWPEAKNHHHAVIGSQSTRAAAHPWQVIMGRGILLWVICRSALTMGTLGCASV